MSESKEKSAQSELAALIAAESKSMSDVQSFSLIYLSRVRLCKFMFSISTVFFHRFYQ